MDPRLHLHGRHET
uniref:Uncharacterized protein n=1 Tax=Rhizophora mucronata TaxID=61149 RepID=A0A2P2PVG0_RHIMU